MIFNRGSDAKWGNKAISSARRGFNKLWLSHLIVERLAQFSDTYQQDRLGYRGLGPYSIEQFFFGDQPTSMRKQVAQHRKRFRPQYDLLRATPQAFADLIETKGTKDKVLP